MLFWELWERVRTSNQETDYWGVEETYMYGLIRAYEMMKWIRLKEECCLRCREDNPKKNIFDLQVYYIGRKSD